MGLERIIYSLVLLLSMKKGVASLALLLGGCVNSYQVPMDVEGVGFLRYHQESRDSYRAEVCFETTDPSRYSVTHGILSLENFAYLMEKKGYKVFPEGNPKLNTTEKGWALCNYYFLVKE